MRVKAKTTLKTMNDPLARGQKLRLFSLHNNDEKRTGILRIKEIIDKTTDRIFISYREKLLSEPITYIISAVWGKIKHGTLTHNQEEIYRIINSMIIDIMEILGFDELNEDQRFAIKYLIRGLVIAKITYLIEAVRNHPS